MGLRYFTFEPNRAQLDTRAIMEAERSVPHPRTSNHNERQSMNSDTSACKALRDMELEVEAEGREWMRRRFEQKLQAQIEAHGAIFPPERKKGTSSQARRDATAHCFRRRNAKGVARKKSR
jgi:hypothetical protein